MSKDPRITHCPCRCTPAWAMEFQIGLPPLVRPPEEEGRWTLLELPEHLKFSFRCIGGRRIGGISQAPVLAEDMGHALFGASRYRSLTVPCAPLPSVVRAVAHRLAQ